MKPQLKKLPYKAIKVQGWLKNQILLQAQGLSGNIQNLFLDVGSSSAWLGGKGEAWERGPYYLDGIVPLAFLLNDKPLLKTVFFWVEKILESKNSQVGFGPLRNNDYWPRMVVQKALISFYRTTSDKRIIPFLLDYYKFMSNEINKHPLYFWAAARSLEGAEAMFEVYQETGQKFVLELMEKLYGYGYDWSEYFSDFKFLRPTSKYISRPLIKTGKYLFEPIDNLIKNSQKIPPKKTPAQIERFNNFGLVKNLMLTHGVNIAMAYKYPLYYGVLKERDDLIQLAKKGYQTVMKYHGLCVGLHSSDEHIMGVDAAGGVELCTVMEQAYTFEEGLRLTKDNFYADLVEYIVFNAMPATFTQDMTAHQYVQQPNQIAADRKPRQFFDTNREANIFGVEPNYGCCAANMHQGFPKYAENLAYTDGERLYFLVYAPCEIVTDQAKIIENTAYPFDDKIRFEVIEAKDLKAVFRIPKFCQEAYHNDKKIDIKDKDKIELVLNSNDIVELRLEDEIRAFSNPDGSLSFRKNNLLFCMPLEWKERYVRGQRPYHYREYIRTNDGYNYSPIIEKGKPIIKDKISRRVGRVPFDREKPPLEYVVSARAIENWKIKYNSLPSPPKNPILSEERDIRLVPYGCSYLRVAQFADLRKERFE